MSCTLSRLVTLGNAEFGWSDGPQVSPLEFLTDFVVPSATKSVYHKLALAVFEPFIDSIWEA